jgi:hypothetical protein
MLDVLMVRYPQIINTFSGCDGNDDAVTSIIFD